MPYNEVEESQSKILNKVEDFLAIVRNRQQKAEKLDEKLLALHKIIEGKEPPDKFVIQELITIGANDYPEFTEILEDIILTNWE